MWEKAHSQHRTWTVYDSVKLCHRNHERNSWRKYWLAVVNSDFCKFVCLGKAGFVTFCITNALILDVLRLLWMESMQTIAKKKIQKQHSTTCLEPLSSCIWGQHGTGQHVLSACSQISTNHVQICTRHRNTHRLKRAAQNAASMYGVALYFTHRV